MPTEVAEQASEQTAAAQTDEGQGGGQVADQQTATAEQASEQQTETAQDPNAVSVLRSNYAHLAPDGDFNKVIALANRGQELVRGGYGALAEQAGGMDLDGYLMLSSLLAEGQEESTETPDAQQAAAQQLQEQQRAAQSQGQPLTEERIAEMMQTQFSDWEQRQQTTQQERDSEQKRQVASQAEAEAYTQYLTELGYTEKPTKVNIEGNDHELDPYYQFVYLPAMQSATQFLLERDLNPNDPDYHQKRIAPAAPDLVKRAAAILKPFFGTMAQKALEQAADAQADLPNASLAGGPGGRAQPDAKDLTSDQARDQAIARKRAAGKIHAEGDRHER